MAVKVTDRRTGEVKVLLNPAEKGALYAAELRDNWDPKRNDALTPGQRAYRRGYLRSRRDNAACYKAQQKKKQMKRTTRSKR